MLIIRLFDGKETVHVGPFTQSYESVHELAKQALWLGWKETSVIYVQNGDDLCDDISELLTSRSQAEAEERPGRSD